SIGFAQNPAIPPKIHWSRCCCAWWLDYFLGNFRLNVLLIRMLVMPGLQTFQRLTGRFLIYATNTMLAYYKCRVLKYVFWVLKENDNLANPLEMHSITMQAVTVAEKSVSIS
ncbi:MAG: hypothetical protein M0R33_04850, partial [Methylomonas sp.]|uniref:hypothetical protein n=1 Tax=Methylomonas sp. TaxID=418 RepID=UPI0025D9C64C